MTDTPTPPSSLPPRPDAQTGQPRPPRAPRAFRGRETTPTDRTPGKHPPLPEGQGPILEWSQDSTKNALIGAAITVLIVAAVPTINDRGVGWMTTYWWMWLIVLFAGFVMYKALRRNWIAAGATWLQDREAWVSTYELTQVSIKARGVNQVLRLTDAEGRVIDAAVLSQVQRNPALWDLVYNGILHSVVTGKADPPRNVRTILKLPGGRGGQHRDGS